MGVVRRGSEMQTGLVLLTLSLVACRPKPVTSPASAPAPASSPLPRTPEDPLPTAKNAVALDPSTPVVRVTGGKLLLGEQPVDDVTEDFRERPRRFDGLYDALHDARGAWQNAHPGATFPGEVAFRLDPNLPSVLVKNVFQSAAFAGHPNGGFVVHRTGAADGMIPFSAIVPRPGEPSADEVSYLLVDVHRETPPVLSWITGDQAPPSPHPLPSPPGTPDFALQMSSAVTAEWKAHGRHGDPTDAAFDLALLRLDPDVPYGTLVEVLDALYEPRRQHASPRGPKWIPIFDARISMAAPGGAPPKGNPSGRLAPTAIQSVIRARYDDLRTCYVAELARNAKLQGKVEVRFKIEHDGTVSSLETTAATTLPDPAAVQCVLGKFRSFVFPKPEGGTVTVVYPILFAPGE